MKALPGTFGKHGFLFLSAAVWLAVTSCATNPPAAPAAIPDLVGSDLSAKQQKIVSIAAYTANGDAENLKRVINQGLDHGLTANEIGEIALQLYAYAGFPRGLNGASALTAVLAERQKAGLRDPFGTEPEPIAPGTDRYALGVANLGTLMGFPLKQQKAETNGYGQAMDAFLKEHLFADIFGRGNLGFDSRELATVGALCALEGTDSQLLFHMNAAMVVGITEGQMGNLVEVIRAKLGEQAGERAGKALAAVLERRRGKPGAPPPAGAAYAYIPELFPRGAPSGNAQVFTGSTFVAPLVPRDSGSVPIVNVTFAPNARTTWHIHSYLQVLLVTLGDGYYQEEGKDPQRLKAGDSVVIPAGVKHWHGSAPGQWFAHVAIIVPVKSDAKDEWLGAVADDMYGKL